MTNEACVVECHGSDLFHIAATPRDLFPVCERVQIAKIGNTVVRLLPYVPIGMANPYDQDWCPRCAQRYIDGAGGFLPRGPAEQARVRRVVEMRRAGMQQAEIARKLDIGLTTVKRYLQLAKEDAK